MPKKIKVEDDMHLGEDEKLIRVDNIHYFVILAVVIFVVICSSVATFVYTKDKYHAHKDVAFNNFEYSEKVDGGYNVYQVYLDESGKVFTYFNTPDGNTVEDKWSYNKYLDFNEEMYESGLFDQIFGAEVVIEDTDTDWLLDVKLINGETIHNSSNFQEKVDKTKFAQVINKYFKQEIIYK